MAPPLPPRRRTLVRGGILAVAAVLLAAGLYAVAAYPPTDDSFYPKCNLHRFTGLHCPGCGMTRSLHSLLNGRVLQAAAYNLPGLLALPFIVRIVALRSWGWLRNRPPAGTPLTRRRVVLSWVIAGAYILYGVLRNLPAWPFTLLAPHEIPG